MQANTVRATPTNSDDYSDPHPATRDLRSRALSALRSGRVKTQDMISRRFTMDAYDEALDAVADSSVVKALIVP